MTRDNLARFQDTYAEAMNKYGLGRGIKGSDARHISTPQYYRDLYAKNEGLKEDIVILEERKQEVSDNVRDLYDRKDEAKEKFLNMDEYARRKEKELADMETRLQQLKQDYEPYKAQEELNAINKYFPMMKEQLRTAGFCKKIGLVSDSIRSLLAGKTLTADSFNFFSPEHNQHFEAKDIRLKIEKEPENSEKLRLTLNGQDITDWFKQMCNNQRQIIRPYTKPAPKPEINNGKGFKV